MKDGISIEGRDGTFNAYIARPKASRASSVVVLQELFGVNADIRKTCDELAERGFVAVAPDLFWRQEPGVDLSVTSEADWQHGLLLYQAYDRDAGVRDIKHPRHGGQATRVRRQDCRPGLMPRRLDDVPHGRALPRRCCRRLSGADTEKYLGEVDNLGAPLLMHLGEEDEFISKAAQDQIKTALGSKQTRRSTATRGSVMPSLGIMERTTMQRRQRSPTGGLANFSINNCGDPRV